MDDAEAQRADAADFAAWRKGEEQRRRFFDDDAATSFEMKPRHRQGPKSDDSGDDSEARAYFERLFPEAEPYEGAVVFYDREYWSRYRHDSETSFQTLNPPPKTEQEMEAAERRWPLFNQVVNHLAGDPRFLCCYN